MPFKERDRRYAQDCAGEDSTRHGQAAWERSLGLGRSFPRRAGLDVVHHVSEVDSIPARVRTLHKLLPDFAFAFLDFASCLLLEKSIYTFEVNGPVQCQTVSKCSQRRTDQRRKYVIFH